MLIYVDDNVIPDAICRDSVAVNVVCRSYRYNTALWTAAAVDDAYSYVLQVM